MENLVGIANASEHRFSDPNAALWAIAEERSVSAKSYAFEGSDCVSRQGQVGEDELRKGAQSVPLRT